MSDAADFRIAVVCTGNRFRSPLAAALLTRRTASLPVEVTSCGTTDLGPVPALPEALAEAATFGLDLSAHRAAGVRGRDLSRHDLVLGFERLHIATAVVKARAPRERTFTLPELVGLLTRIEAPAASDPVERARLAIAAAHEARRDQGPLLPELLDPLGKSRQLQRETAARVNELVTQLTRLLFDA